MIEMLQLQNAVPLGLTVNSSGDAISPGQGPTCVGEGLQMIEQQKERLQALLVMRS